MNKADQKKWAVVGGVSALALVGAGVAVAVSVKQDMETAEDIKDAIDLIPTFDELFGLGDDEADA